MTNSDSGELLIQELLRAVAKEYSWPDFQPVEHEVARIDLSVLRAYVGTYEDPDAGKITVSMKDNTLYVQVSQLGPEPQQLYPESSTHFFILSNDVTFTFQKDDKGYVSTIVVHAFGHSFGLKRIS
jgi:hypothetical protein